MPLLGEGTIPTPGYDRSRVIPGVVHFGVGGFHRAHQAMYQDRLLSAGTGFEYGICGVGVMPGPGDEGRARGPGGIYTLVVKHADGTYEPRVIGSIVDYLFAPDDPEAVIERLAAETTRIVSLTVTEGGYSFTGQRGLPLRPPGRAPPPARARPGCRSRSCPATTSGQRRPHAQRPAFARAGPEHAGGSARRRVPELDGRPDHPADHRRRPPRGQGALRARRRLAGGLRAVRAVGAGGHVHAGRPPYEDVGVQLVEDVEPYELMKLRLLNASHQALCYFGYLDGYRLVHEAAQDPLFARLPARVHGPGGARRRWRRCPASTSRTTSRR